MATLVIGDIHGCFATLQALIAQTRFDPQLDSLWLTGDLVNRGPRSLEVLRWACDHDAEMADRFVTVLGNHDLHLLSIVEGLRAPERFDDLAAVLEAPDAADLIAWLRGRPFHHHSDDDLLVHAGLLPQWTVAEAVRRATEAATLLQRRPAAILGDPEELSRSEREAQAAAAVLTRVRMLDADGQPHPFNGPPEDAPQGLCPWFHAPERRSRGHRIIFGHWAALGVHIEPGIVALDSGCAWGGPLSALRLEDRKLFRQPRID